MNKALLLASVLLLANRLHAQPATAPRPAASFLPKGWQVADSARGDLNGDPFPDLVLALRPLGEKPPPEGSAYGYYAHRRRLLVLWGAEGGRYTLHHASSTLIPNSISTWEPLEELAIPKPGQLLLGFAHQYANESEYGEHVTYRFRYEGNRLRLTGADYHGNTGRTWSYADYSYNFLTGRRSAQETEVSEDGAESPGPKSWRPFPNSKRYYLETMTGAFSIEMKADGIGL